MPEIKIDKIIRSKRKTIALEITPQAELLIRAPEKATFQQIKESVRYKHKWINKKKTLIKKRQSISQPKMFIEGEDFYFLGNIYKLYFSNDSRRSIIFDSNLIISRKAQSQSRALIINWYKKEARKIIKERVDYYSSQFGFRFNNLKITSAQKRWGSCNHKGNLNFTYRLVMAPLSIIDYVVIHELVHLKVPNHSKSYWKKVEKILPDYKQRRKWLKDNGYLFSL